MTNSPYLSHFYRKIRIAGWSLPDQKDRPVLRTENEGGFLFPTLWFMFIRDCDEGSRGSIHLLYGEGEGFRLRQRNFDRVGVDYQTYYIPRYKNPELSMFVEGVEFILPGFEIPPKMKGSKESQVK